jgi:thermostable 8-oxoguanine DNA glycosylase
MLTEANLMNFERTTDQLEELLFFSLCVAGKNSQITMRGVNRLFEGKSHPFRWLRSLLNKKQFIPMMKKVGLGQYNRMQKSARCMVDSEIDLHTCSVAELESLHGIGPKTARFFLAFSRKGVKVAILDVHILRWMKKHGIKTPNKTPSTRKNYWELEKKYLALARRMKQNPAKLDYKVWLSSRKPVNV